MQHARHSDHQSQQVTAVKSRLLPLPPLARAFEQLLEMLPRKLVAVALEPACDIQVLNHEKGYYKSTGNAPWFHMELDPAPDKGGWYYLEASLVRNSGNRRATIYAEVSGKPSDAIDVPIPTNLRGSVREVFYLPRNAHNLRWMPTAAEGFFSQSALLIHKITFLESFCRRYYRVLFDLWRFRKYPTALHEGLNFRKGLWSLQEAYLRTAMVRIKRTIDVSYSSFLEFHESSSKSQRKKIIREIGALPRHPLFTIVISLRNPKPELLLKTLDSVVMQFYANWELLLAVDRSIDAEAANLIKQYPTKDTRIKIVWQEMEADDAARLNDLLRGANGEYVATVRQHDVLQPRALFCAAVECINHPESQLIYSDADHVDESGERIDPVFKPDWNPDLILSQNYFSDLGIFRRDLITELGGYRTGYDGAEEFDLLLRSLAKVSELQIRHLPEILYSRHTTTRTVREKEHPGQHAHLSGLHALQEYLAPTGALAESGPAPCMYRVRHPLPAKLPLVSLIIPTRDQVGILRKCVDSILQKTDYTNWELLIVNNQSAEAETFAYFQEIQRDPRITVLNFDAPFNYSALNNFAVQFSKGEILGLINNDIEVISPGWLSEMVSHAIRPEIGAVGAKLLYEDGMVQHAGVILGIGGIAGHAHKYIKGDAPGYCFRANLVQNFSAVTGACLVVKKQIYDEVAGLNQEDLAIAFNDVDFCLKVREAGYRNIFTPHALLYHHESLSRGHDDTPEKQHVFQREAAYMKKRWRNQLAHDPAYNPNLTLEFENFSLRMNYQ